MNALNTVTATAATASEIDRNVTQALITLYQTTPGAKVLADSAKSILVFPSIVRGGFIVAGQYGDGALRENGKTVGGVSRVESNVQREPAAYHRHRLRN